MGELVAQGIRDVVYAFLRGDTSVPEFTYAFRRAVTVVTKVRPLHGTEIGVFVALEKWEECGWDDRVAAVDELRLAAREAAGLR